MKTPCELIVWNIVPVIKRELAIMLVNEFHLNQKQTAEKLQTTEAAISRYLSGKRGVLAIVDEDIIKEIRKSAETITKNDKANLVTEICRICKIFRSKQMIEGIENSC
jgi:predicted transcriptional regulator